MQKMLIHQSIVCKFQGQVRTNNLLDRLRLRIILKFVMISYLSLVAFLMVADCISFGMKLNYDDFYYA